MSQDVGIPHFKVPFNISGTAAEYVEQDSVDEIEQCVVAVIETPYGSRPDHPDFGLADPTFTEGGLSPEALDRAVGEWEPRAKLLTDSEMDGLIQTVSTTVHTKEAS